MESYTFEAQIDDIMLYGTFVKPCCALACEKFEKCSLKKYKPDDIWTIWCNKPVYELHRYCDVIKIYTFWPFLFERRRNLNEKFNGDLSGTHFCELTLEGLTEMETLEDVTDLAKRFANVPHFIKGLFKIGNEIDSRVFNIADAFEWLRYAEDIGILQKLEALGNYCWPFLEAFFAAYKHYISKVVLEDYNLVEEFESHHCENCIKKSNDMKKRGNEEFAKENFDVAITSYTKAIELWPENHFLYGNRALCFLRTGQYKKALGDGKRSIILKPSWPKGHYRYCDALTLLGEHRKALEANERGQELCSESPEGIKDLIQQHEKLKKQTEDIRGVEQHKYRIKKTVFQKNSSESASVSNQQSKKSNEKKMQFDNCNHFHQKKHIKVSVDAPKKEHKDWFPDLGPSENIGKSRSRMSDSEKMCGLLNSKADCESRVDKKDTPCSSTHQVDRMLSVEKLKTYVKDGCTALMDHRFHSAEQSFAQLLNALDPIQLQPLSLGIVDYVVIVYGYATSLLGIGQPEELVKAEDHFNKIIENYQKVRFNCLAHYGIGKVYLRQNRFSEALDQFMKSKFMVGYKIVPGVLTWPTTSEVIEETRVERLQVMLEDHIEECKFPPNPDAVCRNQQCQARKIKIYFSDPDFKGFIRVTCCEQCIVEFHVSCWKRLKSTKFNDKNDKDFLQQVCFTPDCRGLISKIIVFSSSGLIKCEFEHKIKSKKLPRPIVKQKCSSSRNLKLKHEKKLRRKFMKETALNSTKDTADKYQQGNSVPKHDTHKGTVQKWLTGDTVLQLIIQNTEKIKAGVHDIFKLLNELLSWWAISKEEYAMYTASSASPSEIMEELINYLIWKKNRVKTRIFIHVLSEFEEIDSKLHEWMIHLNRKSLEASEIFFSRYAHSVLQLDFSSVTIQWNETYGIKLGSILSCSPEDYDEEILNFICNSAVIQLRCFIWLLEDNRETFPSLCPFLDEYFDKMDNPFTVLKKQETETTSNNGIKVKNRNRKKPKESRAISVLSGGVGTTTREEDNIFSEENALSFMNPCEPFRIPDDLYDQVEEFEALFSVSSSSSYQRMLDNYPDSTCENLYDYFSQILEEHGPMEIDSPLLIGEYEYFPEASRQIVEDAGGLKSFLLQSLRFIMMGDLIGLMKHAVMLKENVDVSGAEKTIKNGENDSTCLTSQDQNSQSKPRLNPAAKEFKPISHINTSSVPITTDSVASSNLEYMTSCHSSFNPFVPTYSFSSQTSDPIAPAHPMSEVSLPSTLSENQPVFLNEVPPAFQSERPLPVISEILLMPEVTDQSNYIYTNYDSYVDTNPEATSSGSYNTGNLVASDEMQKLQNLQCVLAKTENLPHEQNLDQIEHHSNEAGSSSVTKVESDNKSVIRNNPSSRMIAIQVDHEVTDAGVNTLPFHPYEMQQGDMLRVEKEHQVLQEQLKEANGKYEQLKCRSSEEISVLEEELEKSIGGNKLAKKELDWFHTDLEMTIKRWQQEKKENQEGLKARKSKIKKLTDTNEIYKRNIDEKEKQYKLYLDEFLEISNKFENEKVKMEELIKKSRKDYLERVKQAVVAEVSVLKNWRDTELYKLHGRVTHAEATLKYLKVMNSCSASPDMKFQVDSLVSFISNIKEEMGKAESQFEKRICMVKNGAFLNSIPKVEIAEFELPPILSSATYEQPLINDPAVVMYSAGTPHPPSHLLVSLSTVKDNSPLHCPVSKNTGSKISHKNFHVLSSACENSGEALLEGTEKSRFDTACLSKSPRNSRRHVEDIQLQHSTLEEPAAVAGLDHNRAADKQALPQPSENIIEQLRAIFPDYTSSDFEIFIKELKVSNRNELSMDEILNFILDRENKKKINSSPGNIEKPSSSSSGQSQNQSQKIKISRQNVPSTSNSRSDNRNIKKKTLRPASTQLPWKTDGGIAKSKWKKSSDATDSDPCVICHEELSMEEFSVLDCGHRFHKLCIGPWIKEHSTCPTCRRHVLLPEDYPELPGRNRCT